MSPTHPPDIERPHCGAKPSHSCETPTGRLRRPHVKRGGVPRRKVKLKYPAGAGPF